MKKILLAALSNPVSDPHHFEMMKSLFEQEGWQVDTAGMCYEIQSPAQKAQAFNEALVKNEYDWIVDVSGGDLANLCLPFLDFEAYKKAKTFYAGFSDCTVIVNALFARTGKPALLFPLWNQQDLHHALRLFQSAPEDQKDLVIGGNVRCFLKLAGTAYWPELSRVHTLFLESMSMSSMAFYSYCGQLAQLNAFEYTDQIILGHFNRIEQEQENWTGFCVQVLQSLLPPDHKVQILVYPGIGHIPNSDGIWIGAGFEERGQTV